MAANVGRWEILDYRDFIYSEDFKDGRNVYHVKIPYQYGGMQIIDRYGNYMAREAQATTVVMNADEITSVGYYMPAGYTGYFTLSADNIPSGSIYSGNVSVWLGEPDPYGQVSYKFRSVIAYYDEKMTYISNQAGTTELVQTQDERLTYTYKYTTEVVKPAGARYMVFYWLVNIEGAYQTGTRLHVQYTEPMLTIDIDSAYIEQQKADQLMNGTPEQNESANNAAGQMGEQADKIDSLIDQATPERPNLDAVDRTDVVPNAGVSVLTSTLSPIINNELVVKIMLMVATLMLVGYVLFGKKGG